MFIIITSFTTSLFFTVLASTATRKNETCVLPNTDIGSCIPVPECSQAHQLILLHDITSLQKLTCGFDGHIPLVCCSSHLDSNQIKFNISSEDATTRPTTRPINRPNSSTAEPPSTPYLYDEATTSTEKSIEITITAKLPDTSSEFSKDKQPVYINVIPKETVAERQPVFDIPKSSSAQTPAASKNSSTKHQLSERDLKLLLLPDRKTCGDNTLITERIYGGEIAGISEFPWVARIKGTNLNTGKEIYLCAGTLISSRYVMTAAHCVVDKTPISSVRFGEWDTETDKDCDVVYCNDPPVDIAIEKAIRFPTPDEFSHQQIRNDIALLRLHQPVNFTEFIKPICLPTTDYVAGQDYIPESMYVTAGWGRTESSRASTVLQKADLPAVNVDICKVAVPAVPLDQFPYVICAGGRKGIDSCVGDSGGGLYKIVREEKQSNWYLFGITSYGSGRCGSEGIPSIYTRVAAYMDWILSELHP